MSVTPEARRLFAVVVTPFVWLWHVLSGAEEWRVWYDDIGFDGRRISGRSVKMKRSVAGDYAGIFKGRRYYVGREGDQS